MSGAYVDVAPHAAKVTEVLKYDRLTLHGLAAWKQSEFDITSYSLFVCMIKMLHRTWCSTEHTKPKHSSHSEKHKWLEICQNVIFVKAGISVCRITRNIENDKFFDWTSIIIFLQTESNIGILVYRFNDICFLDGKTGTLLVSVY